MCVLLLFFFTSVERRRDEYIQNEVNYLLIIMINIIIILYTYDKITIYKYIDYLKYLFINVFSIYDMS